MHILIPVLILVLVTGCGTTYNRYTYTPRPASETVELPASEDGSINLLASVLGIQTSPERGLFIDLRIRVNNDSQREVAVEKEGLELYSANLSKFHLLYTEPDSLSPIPPGDSFSFNAAFGFPQSEDGRETDLSGLSLRWELLSGGKTVTGNTAFERKLREEYKDRDRYWHDPYPFHFSTGWYYIW